MLHPETRIGDLGIAHEVSCLPPEESGECFAVRTGIHFRGVSRDGNVQIMHADPALAVAARVQKGTLDVNLGGRELRLLVFELRAESLSGVE